MQQVSVVYIDGSHAAYRISLNSRGPKWIGLINRNKKLVWNKYSITYLTKKGLPRLDYLSQLWESEINIYTTVSFIILTYGGPLSLKHLMWLSGSLHFFVACQWYSPSLAWQGNNSYIIPIPSVGMIEVDADDFYRTRGL